MIVFNVFLLESPYHRMLFTKFGQTLSSRSEKKPQKCEKFTTTTTDIEQHHLDIRLRPGSYM